ncbi:MAG: hemolysin family protein [Planctomycetota bacterium]|nr:hemolysin family protein [Planctomycetota bacterium]
MGFGSEIAVLVGLILLNGLFSGAEIALVSVRPTRLAELAEAGSRGAAAALRLKRDPERLLATVQVAISIVGAGAGAFGGAAFAADLAPLVARFEPLAAASHEIALVVVVAVVAYLSLVLGELVPKSLALRGAETYALVAARPIEWLSVLARPAIWFLMKSSNAVLRLFGDRTTFVEGRISREELIAIVDEASERGGVDPEAGEIASRALDLSELTARDVMVHRRYVVALPESAQPEKLREALLVEGHRRVPVYGENIDDVKGYVSWRDVLERLWDGRPIDVASVLRPCWFVPDSTGAMDLLREMQRRRAHMAVVVDEHGGTAGIVTLEDLLEELVGEIESEHDTGDDWLAREPDGAALVQGTASIRDVNRALELELEEPDDVTTISGLCVRIAGGRLPRRGEVLRADGATLEAVEVSNRRVRSVRIRQEVRAE